MPRWAKQRRLGRSLAPPPSWHRLRAATRRAASLSSTLRALCLGGMTASPRPSLSLSSKTALPLDLPRYAAKPATPPAGPFPSGKMASFPAALPLPSLLLTGKRPTPLASARPAAKPASFQVALCLALADCNAPDGVLPSRQAGITSGSALPRHQADIA